MRNVVVHAWALAWRLPARPSGALRQAGWQLGGGELFAHLAFSTVLPVLRIVQGVSMARCELAVDAHCDLGESPVWDAGTQTLYFAVSGRLSMLEQPPCRLCLIHLRRLQQHGDGPRIAACRTSMPSGYTSTAPPTAATAASSWRSRSAQ